MYVTPFIDILCCQKEEMTMTTVVVEYKKRYYLLTGAYPRNSLLNGFLRNAIRHKPSYRVLHDAMFNARIRGYPVWRTTVEPWK